MTDVNTQERAITKESVMAQVAKLGLADAPMSTPEYRSILRGIGYKRILPMHVDAVTAILSGVDGLTMTQALPATASKAKKAKAKKAAPKAKKARALDTDQDDDEGLELGEGEEEEEAESKSVIRPKYRAIYRPQDDTCADAFVEAFKAFTEDGDGRMDLDALQKVATDNGVDMKPYAHLNNGMKRMNLGNKLRGMQRNNVTVWIGKQKFEALAPKAKPAKAKKAKRSKAKAAKARKGE